MLFLVLFLVACTKDNTSNQPVTDQPDLVDVEEPAPTEDEDLKPPFEGKIAIITNSYGANYVYDSMCSVIDKYGEDRIIIESWPLLYELDLERKTNIVSKLCGDLDIKAIIVNPALSGIDDVFEKVFETRKDIYVIYIDPDLYFGASAYMQTADIILKTDKLNMGPAIARQAKKLGAETLVHYTNDLTFDTSLVTKRLELIKQTCNELGLESVHIILNDPFHSYQESVDFLNKDVSKLVQKYGKNTAFFTLTSYKLAIIQEVINAGAICPQAGDPSFFHGVFGMSLLERYPEPVADLIRYCEVKDIMEVMAKPYPLYSEYFMPKARQYFDQYDMQGRLSAWPVDENFMYNITATEYAVKWINGEVPKEGVDVAVLKQLMEDFAGVEVWLTPFVDDGTYDYPKIAEPTGKTYDNFLMMRMDYITF
jgi:hypothetical protein